MYWKFWYVLKTPNVYVFIIIIICQLMIYVCQKNWKFNSWFQTIINNIILLAQLTRSKRGGWVPAFSRDRSLALDEARQPMPDIQFSQSNRVIVYLPSESCDHVSGQCQKEPSVGTNQMWFNPMTHFRDMKGHQGTTQASASIGAPASSSTTRRVAPPYRCTHAHAITPIPSSPQLPPLFTLPPGRSRLLCLRPCFVISWFPLSSLHRAGPPLPDPK